MSVFRFRKARRMYEQEQASKAATCYTTTHLTLAELEELLSEWWPRRHDPKFNFFPVRKLIKNYVVSVRKRRKEEAALI